MAGGPWTWDGVRVRRSAGTLAGATVKHYAPAPAHLGQPAVPARSMRALLESRRGALQAMIRERHRQAREHHKAADVKMLSATLRVVKSQIARLGDG